MNKILCFSLLLLAGCTAQKGIWVTDEKQPHYYTTYENYVLSNGKVCGTVMRSDMESTYSAYVHDHSVGTFVDLEHAKHAVDHDIFCRW